MIDSEHPRPARGATDADPARRFDLLRYFTSASLAVIVAGTVLAGLGAAAVVHRTFLEMEKDEADSLGEDIVSLLANEGFGPTTWGTAPLPDNVRRELESEMRNFDTVEFSLFANDGRPLVDHSLVPGSERPPWPEAHAKATRGEVTLRWESDDWWIVDLLRGRGDGGVETYAPVRDHGTVIAVTRVRRDLTPILTNARRMLPLLLFGSALFGVSVFAALFVLVRKADGTIGRQYEALASARAELERQNELLERLNRRKDEFYAICSDDLRAPIEAVRRTCRRLTATDAPVGDAARRLLEEGIEQSTLALALIDDLIDLARFGEDVAETVDLVALVHEVAAAARVVAASRGVTIDVTTPGAGASAQVDRSRLLRAVSAIVVAAVRDRVSGAGPTPAAPVTIEVQCGVSTFRIAIDGFEDAGRLARSSWPPSANVEPHAPDPAFGIARELAVACDGSLRPEAGPRGRTRAVLELPIDTVAEHPAPEPELPHATVPRA